MSDGEGIDRPFFRDKTAIAVLILAIVAILLICMADEAMRPAVTSIYMSGAPNDIVYFSDPHLKDYNLDYINDSIEYINSLNPSVILIGGDFVSTYYEDLSLQKVWQNLKAPHIYTIFGNHDYQAGSGGLAGPNKMYRIAALANTSVDGYDISMIRDDITNHTLAAELKTVLEDAGITVLRNEKAEIDAGGIRMRIVGLDDGWAGLSDPHAVNITPDSADCFTVYMVHEFECAADWDADIVLSGHTHGGQFAVPLLYILNAAKILQISGFVEDGSDGKTPHYITRGLGGAGAAGIEMRYHARPEIVVINPSKEIKGSSLIFFDENISYLRHI
ncbi:metallophosphoesterase [Methanomicrobium mobile]|uniref:metallophosphoesterase n=1 Tax=Methanomicrobium mobile TaxID=2205 RepID=UPI000694ADD5|nr:metallophosphoesterase [Methanomicrobium mobile]